MKTHYGKDMIKEASRCHFPKSLIDTNLCVDDIEPRYPSKNRQAVPVTTVLSLTELWRVTKVSCTLGSQVKDNKRTPEASVLPCMFFSRIHS